MTVRLLNKKEELDAIKKWLPFSIDKHDLPNHLYAAENENEIVAIAGFRMMEGPVCFLDSMASDQSKPSKLRNDALDLLTKTILTMAKSLGFTKIFATTKEECIVNRAEKHGFKLMPLFVISKELV